jgi:hypothetical protein
MPYSVNLLVATQDAAAAVLNATVAAQAVKIDDVEIYEAAVRNVGLVRSFHYATDFLFPVPGRTVRGAVMNISVADEDDLKLLNDALDHYFGARIQPGFREQAMKLKAKKKGYIIDPLMDEKVCARVRIPSRDPSHAESVDAYFGYLCRPLASSFEELKTAYPGLVETDRALLPMGCASEPRPMVETSPGIEVFLRRLDFVRNNDRRAEVMPPDDLMFFRHLLHIYNLSGSGAAELDVEMVKGFAKTEKDVLPFVEKIDYCGILGKDKRGKFKSCEEIMADTIKSMGALGEKLLED